MIRALSLMGVQDSGLVQAEQLPNGALHLLFQGTEDFLRYVPRGSGLKVTKALLLGEGRTRSRPRVDNFDVVVNSIADPDASHLALEEAASLLEGAMVPVINHPTRVLRTTRDGIAAMLQDVEGLHVPRTLRVTPRRLADVEAVVRRGGIDYPFLFRPAGTHGGTALDRITGPGDLPTLEKYAFDGRDYYLTSFVDFRSPDGLYRKLRFFVVDGRPYPRHMIITDQWNIHQRNRLDRMAADPALRAEEMRFIEDFDPASVPAIEEIHRRVGLDYFAVDCARLQDGQLVVFEVNAGARLANDARGGLPRHVRTIVSAMVRMIRERVREADAATA